MRLTTLILIAAIMQVSANSMAQKIVLNKKNISLENVFKEIRKQTGYNILYLGVDIKDTKNIDVNFNNQDLDLVLTTVLADQAMTYEIENKTIVVKEKELSFLDKLKTRIKDGLAQITVRGKVVDSLGNPMMGVLIKEKGKANITKTDGQGTYVITLTDNNAVVTFSYVGFEVREYAVKNLPQAVTLHVRVANLHEVVINKGYYSEKQALSTGSVSVVSAKEIGEQPVTDPIQALIGRVPGLYIQQQSGVPGANSLVRLRGQNSIANGNDPLYVIDGVPYSNSSLTPGKGAYSGAAGQSTGYSNTSAGGLSPFNLLNPTDIETIEVLKDADATAIYGSRGANGVILITTKKGKPGNTLVNVDFSQGASQVAHFLDLMNTPQYLQVRQQAYASDGITTIPANAYDINGVWDKSRYTDWQKTLIGGTAHYSNAQVSVSGGSENTQFYIGSGYSRNTTVFPGDFNDTKNTLNFNLTHSSANKRFQMTFSGGYTHDNNSLPNSDLTSPALTTAPDAPAPYNANGSLNWQLLGGTATFSNPLVYTLQTTDAISNSLISNLALNYTILPGLTFKVNTGYNYAVSNQTNLTPSTSIAPPNDTNPASRRNQFGNSEITNWIVEPQLSYTRKISKGELNILAGTSFQKQYSYSVAYKSSGYTSDALLTNPANATTFQYAGESDILYNYTAVYARLNYTWADKYLLNITARRDGSSRFGPGNQFGNFGAAGIGWVFSKEKFAENNLPWLSFGKLRASYGITGNDQITDYQYLSSYSSNSSTYQGVTGLVPTRIPNPYYGWEVNKKLEVGLDLSFLKDRINLTADYYRNRSGNQLVGYPLPAFSGFPNVQANLPAVVQNSGGEFTLNTTNIQTNSFKWSSSLNLSIQSNKLVSFPGLSASSYQNLYVLGQSLFIGRHYDFAGVNPADGVYQFRTSSGTLSETPSYPTDLVNTKPVTQSYFGMLGNSFSYKNFQLDVSFQFVKQYKVNYYGQFLVLESAGTFNYNLPAVIAANTWQTPGTQTEYGVLSTQNKADPSYRVNGSTFAYGDASFIRLKNAALSYTLPKNWQAAMHLKNVRLYVQGQNLLTFTNYFGLDPSTAAPQLPSLRTIVFGVHATL